MITILEDNFGDLTDIHQYYLCRKRNCTDLSVEQTGKDKFQHKWLFERDTVYNVATGMWCLVFAEKEERRGPVLCTLPQTQSC